MTDKQIIIDGEYWRKKYGDMHIRLSNKVAELEQQLQAKEQECERWKEEAIKRSKELIRIRKERQEGQKMNRNLHKQLDQLKAENEELKKIIERLDVPKHEVIDMDIALENERLKAELQRYKDMETKGLEEFKDVGGCWGCGIQSSLDQMTKDYTELKAENEELKKQIKIIDDETIVVEITEKQFKEYQKLKQTLTEIKEIAEDKSYIGFWDEQISKILEKISEVLND